MAFSDIKPKSVGGKLLLVKQQVTHQKRLKQIYERTPRHYASTPQIMRKNPSHNKFTQHENYEHHKNIKHLFNFISRKKSMADRLKDPHDFYAYPVYFFREQKIKKSKKTPLKKKKRPTVHSYDNESQQSEFTRRFGIDLPTVKQMLPPIEQFSEEAIEEYADSIVRIIYHFNLKTAEQVQFLKTCVMKTSQGHYPKEFPQIVDQIFEDIVQSLGLQ